MATNYIQVREYDEIIPDSTKDKEDIKSFAIDNQYDADGKHRPVIKVINNKIIAQNYAGVIQTRQGTVIEILPKIHPKTNVDNTTQDSGNKAKKIFFRMLRQWINRNSFSHQSESSIATISNYNMLDIFITLFIKSLFILVKKGLAKDYISCEENLPYMKGRLQLTQHIRHNLAHQERFFVSYDIFNVNRPVNRLIRSAVQKLTTITSNVKNYQELRLLDAYFDEVPHSTSYNTDWERQKIDRSNQHYSEVMKWVKLVLFNQGLATYKGNHFNLCLLFPMERLFENYVEKYFLKNLPNHSVSRQDNHHHLATDGNKNKEFGLRPDIVIREKGQQTAISVLDAKWKVPKGDTDKIKINQADAYQMYVYGEAYDCNTLVLVYPKTYQNRDLFKYTLINGRHLYCLPFDLEEIESNKDAIYSLLTLNSLTATSFN